MRTALLLGTAAVVSWAIVRVTLAGARQAVGACPRLVERDVRDGATIFDRFEVSGTAGDTFVFYTGTGSMGVFMEVRGTPAEPNRTFRHTLSNGDADTAAERETIRQEVVDRWIPEFFEC